MEKMGIKDDEGTWLPFAIDLESISAVKMTTDEPHASSFNCSTIFCKEGGTFIVDTPFDKLIEIWGDYIGLSEPNNLDNDIDNLNL
jgi:hypothetical protein